MTCWHLLKVVITTGKKEPLERLGLVWGTPDIPPASLEIALQTQMVTACTTDKATSYLSFPLTCDRGRAGYHHVTQEETQPRAEGLLLLVTSRAEQGPCGSDSKRPVFPTRSRYCA